MEIQGSFLGNWEEGAGIKGTLGGWRMEAIYFVLIFLQPCPCVNISVNEQDFKSHAIALKNEKNAYDFSSMGKKAGWKWKRFGWFALGQNICRWDKMHFIQQIIGESLFCVRNGLVLHPESSLSGKFSDPTIVPWNISLRGRNLHRLTMVIGHKQCAVSYICVSFLGPSSYYNVSSLS